MRNVRNGRNGRNEGITYKGKLMPTLIASRSATGVAGGWWLALRVASALLFDYLPYPIGKAIAHVTY